MQENRLAWIFGSSRSGSRWLLKMLSDLQGVVPVDGHHLGVWRPIPLDWAACAVRAAYESRAETDRVLIRYEELRGDETEGCLRRICEVAGIDPERVPEAVGAHRFERQPSAARGRRRFIRQARPGGWRDSLSAAEQRAMHEAMGDALAEIGYAVDEPLAATG